MKELKKVVEDIRDKLDKGLFVSEEPVRLSLVTRVCQVLGWDIWNPAEFNTEFTVIFENGSKGHVDIALFRLEDSEAAQVIIEVKTPGKLSPSQIGKWEKQLKQYNDSHYAGMGIITDGIVWRFYAPGVCGATIADSLVARINILKDDIDVIVNVFKDILHKDVSRIDALSKATEMHRRLKKIQMVQSVKQTAIEMNRENGKGEFTNAKEVIDNQYKDRANISIDEIKAFWNETNPFSDPKSDKKKGKAGSATAKTKSRIKKTQIPAAPAPTMADPATYNNCVNVYINHEEISAWGCYDVETRRFTLCRGSELLKHPKSELNKDNAELRKKMITTGFLMETPDGKKYVLTDDYTFDHISHATAIVLDRRRGGYERWHDEEGKNLSRDYKPSEAIRSKVNPKGKSIIRKHPNLKGGDLKVYIDSTELTATGHYSPKSKKITVYRGSEVQKEHDPALRKIHIEKKKDLIDKQILLPHPTKEAIYIFAEDCPLSLTQAAVIVLGKKCHGDAMWLDENGDNLRKHKVK